MQRVLGFPCHLVVSNQRLYRVDALTIDHCDHRPFEYEHEVVHRRLVQSPENMILGMSHGFCPTVRIKGYERLDIQSTGRSDGIALRLKGGVGVWQRLF